MERSIAMRDEHGSRIDVVGALALLLYGASASAGTIEGTASHPKEKGDLVVYVVQATGEFRPPEKSPRVDQKGMKFLPFVLPVLVGTTVDFANSDPVEHNVYSPDGEGFNLGTWMGGETRNYTFKAAGTYRVLCSLHPEMLAYVVVRPNPYFAVTDKTGRFTISGIPDGRYELKVLGHKVKKPDQDRTFSVEVSGGKGTVSISFGP